MKETNNEAPVKDNLQEKEVDIDSINSIEEIDKLLDVADPELRDEPEDLLGDPEEGQPTDKSEEKDSNEKDQKEEKAKEPEVDPKGQSQTDNSKPIITDDIISRFSPEDQKILSRFKGKEISEALKSLVEAQRLVGRRQQESQKPQVDNTYRNEGKPLPEADSEAGKDYKAKMLTNRMMQRFGNKYPKTDEDWTDLNYNNPKLAFQIYEEEKRISEEIDNDYRYISDVTNTYPERNDSAINEAIDVIKSEIQKWGFKPEDIGIDLSRGEDGGNQVIDSLLVASYDPSKYDPNVVKDFFGVPLIDPEALAIKFLRNSLPGIIEKARVEGRKEGFQQKSKSNLPPSISKAANPGKVKTNEDIDIDNITDLKKLDEILENL